MRKHKSRILLTSRDPGAAAHISQIFRWLSNSVEFLPVLYASEAAFTLLRNDGLYPSRFRLDHCVPADLSDGYKVALLSKAKEIIDIENPDAIICSLSGNGVGIDEAMIEESNGPTFMLQDYWGDANTGLGSVADIFFVLDQFSADLTLRRWGRPSVIFGSPKHLGYKNIDVLKLREVFRSSIGVSPLDSVIACFLQSSSMIGHDNVFLSLASSLAGSDFSGVVLVRGHPKYPADALNIVEGFHNRGIRVRDVSSIGTSEEVLAACDLLTSAFSTSGLDHAYLSCFSSEPIGTVLYLMFDVNLRAEFTKVSGFSDMVCAMPHLAHSVFDVRQLEDRIKVGLSDSYRQEYFHNSKKLVTKQTKRILMDTLKETLQL